MATYRVYCDPENMQELCALSPFNLIKDLKNIQEDELNNILTEIGNELHYSVNNPPTVAPLYWSKERRASYSKIRVMDVSRTAGKSNGYRCIVLVDTKIKSAFVLHIYRHGHGEDKNISKHEKNKLRILVDEYVKSMNEVGR